MSVALDPAQIRERADIVKVVGDRIQLRKRGPDLKGLCPFHAERTPSFSVRPSIGRWHCFGCEADGDAIDFVMRFDGVSFSRALAILDGSAPAQPRPAAPPRPAADARPLLAAIWSAVADAPWGARTHAYLEGRGIEPDAAYAAGCRDWSTVAREVGRIVADADPDILEAAGLAGWSLDDRTQTYVRKTWAPLSRLSDPAWAGIAVPVWRANATAPSRWRWRFVARPWPEAPKGLACYAAGEPTDLLGCGGQARPEGSQIRLASTETTTLLIVEGEPDWWSAVEAVGGRAYVIAVCNGATRWRDAWPPLRTFAARGFTRIVVCAHEGKPDAEGKGHGMRLAEDIAVHAQAAGLEVRARLPQEGHDLNDLHRAGELRRWLEETMS